MTIGESLIIGSKRLFSNRIIDNNFIAKQLLCIVLDKDKKYILINKNKEITQKQYEKFDELINEVVKGKPVQYITNNQEFYGLNFFVNEDVLIPQPDTEIVVEEVIKIYEENYQKERDIRILDLCTGSGAIAITLDKLLNKDDNIKIYGTDISKEALEIADKNNKINNTNVNFILSDMFNNLNEKFDIIVSNPPYVEKKRIATLPKDVQAEPQIALNGGIDGLHFYRIISNNAYRFLNNNGYICVEIGYNQKNSVSNLFKKNDKYSDINIIKDLSNNYRCIVAKVGD